MWCLPPQFLDKLKTAIADGTISEETFHGESQARRDALTEVVGKENAEQISTMYEKNLLLKNTEAALFKTIKQTLGLNEEAKAELMAKTKERIAERSRRLYDPAENEPMLNEVTSDIYAKKYGTEVSLENAQAITELAADAKVKKEELLASGKDGVWAEKRALDNYVNALRLKSAKPTYELTNPLTEKGIGDKLGAVAENFKVSARFIADNSRSLVASIDNSLWGRQGLKMAVDPKFTKAWFQDFQKSFGDMGHVLKGEIGTASVGDVLRGKDAVRAMDAVKDAVYAEIYGRQNFLKGYYEKKGFSGRGLDINSSEEAYPTSLPSKIPILGRLFAASETAYEVGATRLRADAADIAYKGVDMADAVQVGNINSVINSITGRGRWGTQSGSLESFANVAVFSLKNIKSQVDYIMAVPNYVFGGTHDAGRKLAVQNFVRGVITTAIILKMAQTLHPDDNKDMWNTTSTNFGKIRIGHMTIDMTGGYGSLVVMMARFALGKSTSGTTGITKKLNSGYGSQTGMDVIWNAGEGKFAPIASLFRNFAKQQTFGGGKPTVPGELLKLVTPITAQNAVQFKSEPLALAFAGLLADGFGFSANESTPAVYWEESSTKELTQFREKKGIETTKEAGAKFNELYVAWLDKMNTNATYQNSSDEDKAQQITKKKIELKDRVFRQYGFKYKPERQKRLPKLPK